MHTLIISLILFLSSFTSIYGASDPSLVFIPSDEKGRQLLVMLDGSNGGVIDTIMDTPSSDILIDYMVADNARAVSLIIKAKGTYFYYNIELLDIGWKSKESVSIGATPSHRDYAKNPDLIKEPPTYKLAGMREVHKTQLGETRKIDIAPN